MIQITERREQRAYAASRPVNLDEISRRGAGPVQLADLSFAELRRREFARLDTRDHDYLDYAGSGLHFESHVSWHLDLLRA